MKPGAGEASEARTDPQNRFFQLEACPGQDFLRLSLGPANVCFGIVGPIEQRLAGCAVESALIGQAVSGQNAYVFRGVE